ncbi:MAG: hypothetical protein KGY51_11595 [Psychroflexus sp.]|nr:hypothetical protein [Psychroflexus sp.]
MKYYLFLALCITVNIHAQNTEEDEKKDYGRVYGGFESNSQYYLDDDGLNFTQPDQAFRSNNYLYVNYNYKNWTAGIQAEGYEPNALLNYNPKFEGTNLGIYYLDYQAETFQVTLGHFYEQFGSGILLRAWEDRALGINSALRGGRIKYSPNNNIDFTVLYGRQRSGFNVTNGDIYGFDTDIFLGEWLNLYEKNKDLSIGFSYVGRYESLPFENPNFDELTNSYSFRFDFISNYFYLNGEASYKEEDGIINSQENLSNDFVEPGHAFQLNFGYSSLNYGIDVTLRRVENMSFLSEREPETYTNSIGDVNSSTFFLDGILNFVPALTKQHHSQLSNINVYQALNGVSFIDPQYMSAGETGGQLDFFYTFPKESTLGGKYGTYVSVNLASWYNLPGNYTFNPPNYDVDFFGIGNKFFQDYSIEVTKKLSEDWRIGASYIDQFMDYSFIDGRDPVNADIIVADATYNFTETKSIRLELEKMWSTANRKDWVGGTLEYNLNENFSFYTWDIYNYGSDKPNERVHYLNFGGSYRKGRYRVAVNYGRQRGGLVCVGGVCRFVPESSGLTLSFNTSF